MRLSDYRNFVEEGVQQTSDGVYHLWAEWQDYPSAVTSVWYTAAYPLSVTKNYVFLLQNGVGHTWEFWYTNAASRAVATSWSHYGDSPDLVAYDGVAETELSKYGTQYAKGYVSGIQHQDAYHGAYVKPGQSLATSMSRTCQQANTSTSTATHSGKHLQETPLAVRAERFTCHYLRG
jgi:hypothetical protein